MRFDPDPVHDLLGLTAECSARDEYLAARLEWLERVIGCDAAYFGPAEPAPRTNRPVVSGLSEKRVARCEAHTDRYQRDLSLLTQSALERGGVMADHDVIPAQRRDRMPFYREVVKGHGIVATAVSVYRMRGRPASCMYLGRTSRGARFAAAELECLRRSLPALVLGEAVHVEPDAATLGRTSEQLPLASLTARERAVLRLICTGFTNAEIAASLGSSPFTVKNQVSSILAKTATTNRTQLVARMAQAVPGRAPATSRSVGHPGDTPTPKTGRYGVR